MSISCGDFEGEGAQIASSLREEVDPACHDCERIKMSSLALGMICVSHNLNVKKLKVEFSDEASLCQRPFGEVHQHDCSHPTNSSGELIDNVMLYMHQT